MHPRCQQAFSTGPVFEHALSNTRSREEGSRHLSSPIPIMKGGSVWLRAGEALCHRLGPAVSGCRGRISPLTLWYDFGCGLAYGVVYAVTACLPLCSPGAFSKIYLVHTLFC